jgi:hypothetical protein
VQAQRHFKNKRLSDANDRKWRSCASFCVVSADLCVYMCITVHQHIDADTDVSEGRLTGQDEKEETEGEEGRCLEELTLSNLSLVFILNASKSILCKHLASGARTSRRF